MIPDGLRDLRDVLGVTLNVVLETGSSTGQGKVMRGGKKIAGAEDYMQNAAVCYMNPEDMRFLGVSDNDNAELKSRVGSIVLRIQKSGCPRGVVFVPKGPWINFIVEAETSQSGSPNYKGMSVSVSATGDKVKNVKDLLREYGTR